MAVARSLHVGVNCPSRSSYPDGYFETLMGCDVAANGMSELAKRNIKDRTVYVTREETLLEHTRKWFYDTAHDEECRFVLFTFAGHGDLIPASNGREKLDQTLVFFDTELVDNELFEWLAQFGRDVEVVIVADCCFSGGILDPEYTPRKADTEGSGEETRQRDLKINAHVMLVAASGGDKTVEASTSPNQPPPFTARLLAAANEERINGNEESIQVYERLAKAIDAHVVTHPATRLERPDTSGSLSIPLPREGELTGARPR